MKKLYTAFGAGLFVGSVVFIVGALSPLHLPLDRNLIVSVVVVAVVTTACILYEKKKSKKEEKWEIKRQSVLLPSDAWLLTIIYQQLTIKNQYNCKIIHYSLFIIH